MIKKHHIFILLITILFYILYNIFNYKYKEYKINEHLLVIEKINTNIKLKIKEAEELIEYKKSKAYKNKILKTEQLLKNKAENVVYLTNEDEYNKFTTNVSKKIWGKEKDKEENKEEKWEVYGMSIYQKWMYFIFKKDLR